MSEKIKEKSIARNGVEPLTDWQKIDALEADIERRKLGKKRRGGMKFKRIFGDTVGQIVLTILSIIWIIPLFYLLIQSFRKEPGAWSPTFFPQDWTLDNYKRLFTETKFLQWYGNTLLIAICSCIITAIFVLSVAYVFSRMKFKARKPMMNVMLILGMFPGFMSMSAVYFLLKILLPDNYQSHLSLVIVYSAGAALSYYIAKGFFDTVPKSLDEAARIDGASRFRTFYKIILPLSKSIIIYTILMGFMAPWGDFMMAKYLIHENSQGMTVAVGMHEWLSATMVNTNYTMFCAAGVLVAIPVVTVFLLLQKYYVEGVTGGAVKG